MAGIPDKQTLRLLGPQLVYIRKRFKPESIILFGSRARGDNLKESDIDLIIVAKAFEHVDFRERIIQAYGMWDKRQGLDVLCYTPLEFEKKKRQMGLVQEAAREGVVIA